jgi:hypothetical protein
MHPYNLSLMSSIVAANSGKSEAWGAAWWRT